MRDELRNRAVLLAAIVAVALALLGSYTWMQTAPTSCPAKGVCLEGRTHRIHPLRARSGSSARPRGSPCAPGKKEGHQRKDQSGRGDHARVRLEGVDERLH